MKSMEFTAPQPEFCIRKASTSHKEVINQLRYIFSMACNESICIIFIYIFFFLPRQCIKCDTMWTESYPVIHLQRLITRLCTFPPVWSFILFFHQTVNNLLFHQRVSDEIKKLLFEFHSLNLSHFTYSWRKIPFRGKKFYQSGWTSQLEKWHRWY